MRTQVSTAAAVAALDAWQRRVTTYLYLAELYDKRRVLEILPPGPPGPSDTRSAELLVAQGAAHVTVIGGEAPRRTPKSPTSIEVKAGTSAQTGLSAATVDVVFALDVAPSAAALEALVAEARRVLKPEGVLIVGVESRDSPGATRGLSYYELHDLMEKAPRGRAPVRMIGQAAFTGATLVEYGVKDPEPVLDGTLVPKGERVGWYVAVCGPEGKGSFGYGVVQLPVEARRTAVSVAGAASPEIADLQDRLRSREQALEEQRDALTAHARQMEDTKTQLVERDAYIAELERDAKARGGVRDALSAAELRTEAAERSERETRRKLAEAEGRLLRSSGSLPPRPATEVAGLPPTSSRLPESAMPTASAEANVLAARVAELEAENKQLKVKEEEARSDSWKHLKARSEAEAAAAEVREDTVRKLKDARKLASVELMRAMEEATKKAVGLREELQRSNADRKEAEAALAQVRTELEALRAERPVAPPPPSPTSLVPGAPTTADDPIVPAPSAEVALARAKEEGEAAVLAARASASRSVSEEFLARTAAEAAERAAQARAEALHGRVIGLERELRETEQRAEAESERAARLLQLLRARETETEEATRRAAEGVAAREVIEREVQAERERFGRLLADVELKATERAERGQRTRQQLKEREREVEALRREIAERDQRLISLERLRPASAEAVENDRLEAELSRERLRAGELELELSRRSAATERAAAAAAHERARAERLVAEERRAIGERNEARARVADAETGLLALSGERDRLHQRVELEGERARKLESELKERKERVKQLKRQLDDAQRSAESGVPRAADLLRARLDALEAALRGEADRAGALEEHLRQAARSIEGNGT
jgi:hypothetical protein